MRRATARKVAVSQSVSIRKAVIRQSDGYVENIIEIEDGANWSPPTGYYLIDAGNGSPGDTWNGTIFIKPNPDPPIPIPLDIPINVTMYGDTYLWNNMPSALTEFPVPIRRKVDLTKAISARATTRITTAGATTGKIKIQYSLDDITYYDLCEVLLGIVGVKTGSWTDIPTNAKADIFVRIAGIGDGIADPTFRGIGFQIK